jgi:hypothetical protein
MEFRSVSGLVNSSQLLKASYSQGKISLPVAREYSLYARFKHVQGVPSETGKGTVPFNRLVVLNSLIEGLSKKQEQPGFGQLPGESSKRLDFLAEQYSRALHMAVSAHPAAFSRNSTADTGLLVNMVA